MVYIVTTSVYSVYLLIAENNINNQMIRCKLPIATAYTCSIVHIPYM